MTTVDMWVMKHGHRRLMLASRQWLGNELMSAGTRGEVTEVHIQHGLPEILVVVVDARDASGSRLDGLIGRTFEITDTDAIEPLVDNWLAFQPKKRYSPASPRKTTSRRVRPNTIPPPPAPGRPGGSLLFCDWLRKTFAKGTRVRFLEKQHGHPQEGDHDRGRSIPPGSVGTVVAIDQRCEHVVVEVWLEEPLFTSSTRHRYAAFVDSGDIRKEEWRDDEAAYGKDIGWGVIEPLDDNWGPLVIAPKRTSKKPQPGWQKQLARSRRVRAMRPNATCPSCGSPHYFESMWHRDCATPTCEYFRGGTVTSPESTEHLTTRHHSSVRPAGSRRLVVTSETVHASEVDVYPEIDNEMEDDIVIEVDDLDEEETFAEKAAEIIASELGYVEGSDGGRGPSRWYTQSDASENYSTGDSERRSIHIDSNGGWTKEEEQEIYDILKKRRLVS
jgi:hypothetical protein